MIKKMKIALVAVGILSAFMLFAQATVMIHRETTKGINASGSKSKKVPFTPDKKNDIALINKQITAKLI